MLRAEDTRFTYWKKTRNLEKKLFITGKGRCNVTNDSDTEELFPAVMSNRKFLYSAFYTYGSRDVMEFFEEAGVPLKTERGNRVFPVSDHSSDIIRALERELKKAGAQIHLHTEVKEVCTQDEKVTGVLLSDGTFFEADAVVVATGGLSYPSTGSTGDGYRFAAETGHKVVSQVTITGAAGGKRRLCLQTSGTFPSECGTDSKIRQKKSSIKDFGEMMFTHFGVTGP